MSNERHEFASGGKPVTERRASERITSIYRPVLIETEDFSGFCLVRNLSPGGMMGLAYAEFAAGQPITLRLPSDSTVKGKVIWSTEGKIGINFDEEIDVEQTLRELSEKSRGEFVNRSPRLEIECAGSLEIGEATVPIRMRDISQRGLKAEVNGVKPGEHVMVHLPGLECKNAVVRWTQGGLAGLNFLSPLGFVTLALWAIEQQSAEPQHSSQ